MKPLCPFQLGCRDLATISPRNALASGIRLPHERVAAAPGIARRRFRTANSASFCQSKPALQRRISAPTPRRDIRSEPPAPHPIISAQSHPPKPGHNPHQLFPLPPSRQSHETYPHLPALHASSSRIPPCHSKYRKASRGARTRACRVGTRADAGLGRFLIERLQMGQLHPTSHQPGCLFSIS
jgi:hypothetical protein